MRAWQAQKFDGLKSVKLGDAPTPKPAQGEVLVKMRSAGVTPFDWAILHGRLDPSFPPMAPPPLILGNQGMGEVADGNGTGFKKGERVMFAQFAYGFARPGSWAEYLCVEAAHLGRVPDDMTDDVAANLPSSYVTAYLALEHAGFAPGKTVLTTGIGGSVGNAAYQLARAMGAKKVFSTTSLTAKAKAAEKAGYDNIIDLSQEPMAAGVRRRNGGEGVDIIIETIGGKVAEQTTACVNRLGTIITLGFSAGVMSQINLMELILTSSKLEGFGVYSRTPEQWQHAYAGIAKLNSAGKIKPLVERTFAFGEAPEAVRHLVEDRPLGTVALRVAG